MKTITGLILFLVATAVGVWTAWIAFEFAVAPLSPATGAAASAPSAVHCEATPAAGRAV